MPATEVMREFTGKVAVVTGAGSGIGEAIARKAAELGMKVVLADVDEERLAEVRADLVRFDRQVISVVTDVGDAAAVDRLSDAAYAEYGSVQLLVNNAGIETMGYIWDMSPQQWSRVLRVNTDGAFHGIRSFIPRMGADPQVSYVVNVASVAAFTSGVLNSAYFASKHALLSLTESLYLECREKFPQINVSVVCPAAVTTRIFEDASASRASTGGSGSERMLDTMREHLRNDGITPVKVADMVFDHLVRRRFWIPTHPERLAEFAAKRASMLVELSAPGGVEQ